MKKVITKKIHIFNTEKKQNSRKDARAHCCICRCVICNSALWKKKERRGERALRVRLEDAEVIYFHGFQILNENLTKCLEVP